MNVSFYNLAVSVCIFTERSLVRIYYPLHASELELELVLMFDFLANMYIKAVKKKVLKSHISHLL